jgi:hypothetical protein
MVRWDFAARPDMPAVKVYWYDGMKFGLTSAPQDSVQGSVRRQYQNWPPLVEELQRKYNRNFASDGTVFVGDKGYMYCDAYGDGVRIVPEEAHQEFPPPPPSLPRIPGGHWADFLRACRGGEPACSNFNVANPLNEMALLGCLAIRAGKGRKVEWDGEKGQVTNLPELNRLLGRENRKGWEA